MPTPSLHIEDARRTQEEVHKALQMGGLPIGRAPKPGRCGAITMAARSMGEKPRTIHSRCQSGGSCERAGFPIDWSLYQRSEEEQKRESARRGGLGYDPVLPGYEIKSVSSQRDSGGNLEKEWIKQDREHGSEFEIPSGHIVKGVSALIDGDGRTIQQWIKTKEGDIDPSDFVAELEAHFATFGPSAEPLPSRQLNYEDQLALYPFADPHFGLYCWKGETAANWDLNISVQVIRDTFERVVSRTPPTKKALLLFGGDNLHADSNENKTARSGNVLQVDGRYPKVLLTACETGVWIADRLLKNHEEVEIIVLGGNHDEHAAFALAFFLHAWFRNEPRAKVDISPSLFRFREFGKVMLGMTHGHMAKIKDMPSIMAARQSEMWGRTIHRYVHGFHVHHNSRQQDEIGGCAVETHQIIAPQDAWHFGMGFLSGRSLKSITYDRVLGERGRAIEMIASS